MKGKLMFIVFIISVAIYFFAINIPVMDVDASQYASMSREMMERGDYLHVYDLDIDYLDKPPFLFWISAASMKIFGANNFAYKLPSILFALLAIYSTYRFALLYYAKIISQISAIVLATSQALFMITNDVRTDTILMSWVILSVWQLAEWLKNKKWLNFIIAFIAIGGGMLTKGPIALFVPVFAFGSHFLLQRNFTEIFKWQYIIGLIIIALVLLPMSIGLYQQFDFHPEKLVNGKHGVSGLRFFYWTQSFGRITGESEWDNNSGFFFLLQNMLWTFLPWIFFFIISFFATTVSLIKNKFRISTNEEFITYGGFLITYCSLAFSRYQLPHYIFVVFPFAAIITARFIHQLCWIKANQNLYRVFYYSHAVIYFILLLLVNVIISYCFPQVNLILNIFVALATIGYLVILFLNKSILPKLFFICVYAILVINIALSAGFYPALLQYQSGNVVGSWVKEHKIASDSFATFKNRDVGHSLHFYADRIVPAKQDATQLKNGEYLFTRTEGKLYLDSLSIKYNTLLTGGDYGVSMLKSQFLNPATRKDLLEPYYILQVIDSRLITDSTQATK